VGKTTIFNKLCDASRSTNLSCYSVTRTYAKDKVFYQGKELIIFDGPGCKSKRDTYNHSYVMRHGLTHEPLNCIFIFVEYNPRIGSNMADDFWEVAKILKPEYLDMVSVIVTKMDHFQTDDTNISEDTIKQNISDTFANDFDVHTIVFSKHSTTKEDLFNMLHHAVANRPAVKLEYSEGEFLQYFDLKAWKGREMHDLYRMKNSIQGLTGGFLEGLNKLEEHLTEYSNEEFQDCVYSAIQQSSRELEEMIIVPFLKRNGESEQEFEDYAAYIELRKLISSAHNEVRNEAKRLLLINPDDTSNWRNALRRCQHCGEVWVKVEGCDGETTCGLVPETGDPYGDESYFKYMWMKVGEAWRPEKLGRRKNTRAVREDSKTSAKQVGCGRPIVWKDQAIVPIAEVDAIFSTQELELILSNFSSNNTDFIAKKQSREKNIPVFAKLDSNGKDIDP
jgi:GTP-binding protein EngB required for normal cell division